MRKNIACFGEEVKGMLKMLKAYVKYAVFGAGAVVGMISC